MVRSSAREIQARPYFWREWHWGGGWPLAARPVPVFCFWKWWWRVDILLRNVFALQICESWTFKSWTKTWYNKWFPKCGPNTVNSHWQLFGWQGAKDSFRKFWGTSKFSGGSSDMTWQEPDSWFNNFEARFLPKNGGVIQPASSQKLDPLARKLLMGFT